MHAPNLGLEHSGAPKPSKLPPLTPGLGEWLYTGYSSEWPCSAASIQRLTGNVITIARSVQLLCKHHFKHRRRHNRPLAPRPQAARPGSKPQPREMELGRDVESARTAYSSVKEQEALQEQGQEATLVLTLPSGETVPCKFKVGVTVAYVKLHLQEAHGLDMSKVVLQMNGKRLLDPLSLLDCPGIAPGKTVEVQVSLAP